MMKEAVESLAASGADLIYTFSFIMLAEVYLTMKRTDECLRALDQIAQRIEQKDHRLLEVEVHRIRGEAILLRPDGAVEAERCFRRAIEIGVRQGANSWRLRGGDEPGAAVVENRQARRGSRSAGAGVRGIHRGIRYERSARGESAARRINWVARRAYSMRPIFWRRRPKNPARSTRPW